MYVKKKKKHQKALRREKKRVAHVENSRPKEHDGEFSGLLCDTFWTGCWRSWDPERPMAARKAQEKPVLSLAEGPEKRQSSKTENF